MIKYQEPNIILYHGDNLNILPTLTDKSIDLVVTSPPYYNAREYSQYKDIQEFKGYIAYVSNLLAQKANMVVVVTDDFVSENYDLPAYWSIALENSGLKYFDKLFWKKNSISMRNLVTATKSNVYLTSTDIEVILVYGHSRNKFNPFDKEYLTKMYSRMVDFPYESALLRQKIHPAIFPLELAEFLVMAYSEDGDTVLDCFMGSGTVAVACKNLDRKCIGIELKEEYIEVEINRLKQEVMFKSSDNLESSLF